MKILLISDYGYLAGGAELMMLRFQQELRRRGHEVLMFTSNASGTAGAIHADQTCLGTESRLRTLLQTANPWAVRGLARVIREFQPDIAHVRMFLTQLSPLILPLLKSVPCIYHVAWYRPVCPTGTKMLPGGMPCHSNYGRACLSAGCLPLQDWLPLMWQMRMLRKWRDVFDVVVANSECVRESLETGGFDSVEVVYNGIPKTPLPDPLPVNPVASFVGRLVPEKGVAVLIDAFSRVVRSRPEARLLIAGDGPERGRLKQLCASNGIAGNVQFLGHVSHDAHGQVCGSASVHVVPSLWAEPFGIVAIEAMFRGQPVIATNNGGLAEIVTEGQTGLLVPPNDAHALAQALLELFEHGNRANAMGKAAYQRAAGLFSLDVFCDRFIRIYERIVSSPG